MWCTDESDTLRLLCCYLFHLQLILEDLHAWIFAASVHAKVRGDGQMYSPYTVVSATFVCRGHRSCQRETNKIQMINLSVSLDQTVVSGHTISFIKSQKCWNQ
jgi:hypothetical protein